MPEIIPESENVSDNPQSVSSENKSISNKTIVIVLVIAIVLLVGVTGFLFLDKNFKFPFKSQQNNQQSNSEETITPEEFRKQKANDFRSISVSFADSINNARVSDELINQFKSNKNYLQEMGTIVEHPSYENTNIEDSKLAFKTSLVEKVRALDDDVARFEHDLNMDFSPSLGRLLDLLSYIARISKSEYLSEEEKLTWNATVLRGKDLVAATLSLMGDYQIEGQKWVNENVYTREEFQ